MRWTLEVAYALPTGDDPADDDGILTHAIQDVVGRYSKVHLRGGYETLVVPACEVHEDDDVQEIQGRAEVWEFEAPEHPGDDHPLFIAWDACTLFHDVYFINVYNELSTEAVFRWSTYDDDEDNARDPQDPVSALLEKARNLH